MRGPDSRPRRRRRDTPDRSHLRAARRCTRCGGVLAAPAPGSAHEACAPRRAAPGVRRVTIPAALADWLAQLGGGGGGDVRAGVEVAAAVAAIVAQPDALAALADLVRGGRTAAEALALADVPVALALRVAAVLASYTNGTSDGESRPRNGVDSAT